MLISFTRGISLKTATPTFQALSMPAIYSRYRECGGRRGYRGGRD
jgi:hypothetical protein